MENEKLGREHVVQAAQNFVNYLWVWHFLPVFYSGFNVGFG